jgi:peptidoglycan hydrolase CwlO-like protein
MSEGKKLIPGILIGVIVIVILVLCLKQISKPKVTKPDPNTVMFEELKTEISDLSSEVTELRQETTDLQTNVKGMSGKVTKLQEQLESTTGELKKLKSAFKKLGVDF